MKFTFEKLGLLDYVEVELADLTLICGENNTGKTYVTYAIYGFLRSWRSDRRLPFASTPVGWTSSVDDEEPSDAAGAVEDPDAPVPVSA